MISSLGWKTPVNGASLSGAVIGLIAPDPAMARQDDRPTLKGGVLL